MKLKFRSSLNKFNPFDSHQLDAKPIDLSLKSRIKNFMKKVNNDEQFRTSSNSLNSTDLSISSSSIHSISPTNSLNHQYDQPSPSIFNGNLHQIPPSPPNSIDEEVEIVECIQQRKQIYYNRLLQKQYENQQLNLTLTDLLSTSHLNQTNEFINQFSIENATDLSVHQNRKQELYNQSLLQCDSNNLTNDDQFLNNRSSHFATNLSQPINNQDQVQHVHYQKQMVIKHTSQMNKRLQNHYNPYSQATKRKHTKQNSDEDEESDDYYDSSKLINKLRMKYCSSNRKQSTVSNNQLNLSNSSPIYNQTQNNHQQQLNQANYNIQTEQNLEKNLSKNLAQNRSTMINEQLNNLQNLYKGYYNYLLSQPNDKLSALQIIMKNILEQNNNNYQFKEEFNNSIFNKLNLLNLNTQQFKNSSIETQSLSSTPSPNSHQTNLINNENYHDLIYLPNTPPSVKDEQTNQTTQINLSPNQQEERKRSSRPLTGRHVRQGTGASPTTLANLRLAIKERQNKSTTSVKSIKRKAK